MMVTVIAFLSLNNVYGLAAFVYVLRCVSQMTQTLDAMSKRLDEISERL